MKLIDGFWSDDDGFNCTGGQAAKGCTRTAFFA